MNTAIARRTLLALGAAALCAATGLASAQNTTPLRVVLPVGAGSGVDTIMRSAQVALSKALGGQPVVIENLPGAGGISGTQAVVKAAPDGNTVGVVSNNHAVNPSVFKKMPYDGIADLTPITVIGGSPFVLVVNPAKVPARNAKELQAFLKAKPGAYNYGSSGNGTIIHLAGEMYMEAAGVEVRHIPYKGMGPMLADIVGGQVEMGVGAVPAVQGHLKAGTLRAIGVMGKQRVASLPDVPTIAEQGFPGVDVEGWFALVGPAKLPAAQVKRLHDAIVAAFNDPEVKAAMARQDNFIAPTTPEAAAQFFRTEQERYARLVKKANVQVE
ncbi:MULTISPECIES: tripartite tricarboxylate transporter substrate binding protein [unclassified Variovorax]|uniref:tripartite tricarboxylate transporter substrate binding protein n=1 Tax=unclassified Variovorax TaxID=663243 RepID=UPI002575E9F3|nr:MULTISPECIES: tripartite tricarboxylate transporter substrate binding protein [unclassified Variovorax]MDM0088699.1 tripartite tricarboxylate transporter substrate binding protein [Variovorax sp. J22G40]MDM0146772.1 tripartite tricarboxylate transporter substrate binding protein [Variovorax sp. J2P1-31]